VGKNDEPTELQFSSPPPSGLAVFITIVSLREGGPLRRTSTRRNGVKLLLFGTVASRQPASQSQNHRPTPTASTSAAFIRRLLSSTPYYYPACRKPYALPAGSESGGCLLGFVIRIIRWKHLKLLHDLPRATH